MKKFIITILSIGLTSMPSFARDGFGSVYYDFDNVTTTTLYNPYAQATIDQPTLQSSGSEGSGNSGMGMILGVAGIAAGGYMAGTNCPSCPYCNYYACALGIAGVVLGASVMNSQEGAKGKSDRLTSCVTVGGACGGTAPNGAGDGQNNGPTGTANVPAGTQAANEILNKMANYGVKVDKNGNITLPNGKTINAKDVSSSAGMSALGGSPKDLAAFNNSVKAEAKKLADKAKGGDTETDMFGGENSGGGAAAAAAAQMPGVPVAAAPRIGGIDRNPAQVAGMAVNLNGDKIGVAADSLFLMIDRRYELHKTRGSFLQNQ